MKRTYGTGRVTCARVDRLLNHLGGRPAVRENVGEVRVLERRRTAAVGHVRRIRGGRQSSGKRRAPRVG